MSNSTRGWGGGGEAGERKKIIKVTAYRLKSNVRMVYELLKESNGWKRLSSISQESFDCAFESMHGKGQSLKSHVVSQG